MKVGQWLAGAGHENAAVALLVTPLDCFSLPKVHVNVARRFIQLATSSTS